MFNQNTQYTDYSLSVCASLSLKLTWYQSHKPSDLLVHFVPLEIPQASRGSLLFFIVSRISILCISPTIDFAITSQQPS